MKPAEGRRRVVVEGVTPQVDGGRFPVKRTVGETVRVEADVFADGHDVLACVVQYRHEHAPVWREAATVGLVNDRWRGQFEVSRLGRWHYRVLAWIDRFATWRHDLVRRVQAEDVAVALQIGAELVEEAARRASVDDSARLHQFAAALHGKGDLEERRRLAVSSDLESLMKLWSARRFATASDELTVTVEPERARFSAWYELFPRSYAAESGRHGTFRDLESHLGYVANLGFDVLYLPPVHPIGRVNRKGRNNALLASPGDPGSPWAIGAEEGGHKAVHPDLGSLEDFRRLVATARELGIEVAIDMAFQCAPDHPYVREHPEWFRHRPDGSVQYAENPPKKYEDIYPFDFETEQWRALWSELKGVIDFWVGQGVTIFRVDNPHTKPFVFWKWLIAEVKRDHPQTLFLSEAFSRPKIMHQLAKLGFSQSYTYFTWRNTKEELTQYLTELTQDGAREYFRPNLWPNTPDILSETLQYGGRPAFLSRLVLASTLAASYGIYGAAYELLENEAREPGSEEYLNSEKYEVKHWPLTRPDSLRDLVARINRIRRENRALQSDWSLRFYPTDNEQVICYGKHTEDLANIVVVVVNLDSYHRQSAWIDLPLERLGIDARHPFQMHELLSDARYLWHGTRNYVDLDPQVTPAQVFRLRRRVRTEREFEYFM